MDASKMTDDEILNHIDDLSKDERTLNKHSPALQKSDVISFNLEDITVWIHLGEGSSVPACTEKRLRDYQSFVIRMFDPDEGDSFGSPYGQGAIYPSEDVRFQGQPWSSHFFSGKRAASVPVADFCQIVRFAQKVQKLTAFL